jgi:hypothetical protein
VVTTTGAVTDPEPSEPLSFDTDAKGPDRLATSRTGLTAPLDDGLAGVAIQCSLTVSPG